MSDNSGYTSSCILKNIANIDNFIFYDVLKPDYFWGLKKIISNRDVVLSDWNSKKVTGGQIRFVTNSKQIHIGFTVDEIIPGNFPHVGITLQYGITAAYRKINEQKTYALGGAVVQNGLGTMYTNLNWCVNSEIDTEIIINIPVFSNIVGLEIGLDKGSYLLPSKKSQNKIMVIGGQQTYGVGNTCANTMYSNIISQQLNTETQVLAFCDSDFLKKLNTALEQNIDNYCIFIWEADHVWQNEGSLRYEFPRLINKLNIFNSPVIMWGTKRVKDLIFNEYQDILKNDRFFFINTEELWNVDEKYTFSPNFINEMGNILIAKKITSIIHEIEKRKINGIS